MVGGEGWWEGVYGNSNYGALYSLPPDWNGDYAPLIEMETPNLS